MSALQLQALDWHAEDTIDFDPEYDDGSDYGSRYVVTVYGRTADGRSVALLVQGFTPHFYVEVPDHWTRSIVDNFAGQLRSKVWKRHRDSIVSHQLISRKKFLGFRNGRQYKFVQLNFHSKIGMSQYIRALNTEAFPGLSLKAGQLTLHETNIDPMLRLMHIRDLQACGWLSVPDDRLTTLDSSSSCCDLAAVTSWKHLIKLDQDTIAPVVIASFDIEADSSHGDFPIAKKGYRKLARELAEADSGVSLADLISLAFTGTDNSYGINSVYTKDNRKPTEASIQAASGAILLKGLLKTIAALRDAKGTSPPPPGIKSMLRSRYDPKKQAVVYEKYNDAIERYLQEVIGMLNKHLPRVEGDHVIQIGTTVTVYGQKETVKRHIVTLGTCDPLPGIVVESCATEKQVLLTWSRFIVELDPDVLTSFNGFGFDNKFMWDRAEELACVYEFAKLSRVPGLSEKLTEKKLASSALGDNTYYILPMRGRVQIDLLKAVQNNPSYKMDSYKLDNVANVFMRGPVKETKLVEGGTRIITGSTKGLKENGWVTLVQNNGIIEEPFLEGRKLQISDVTPNSFEIGEELDLDPGIKYSWCESKDDVTAADIFRLQKGSCTDRALVAKYCVQDCELVGRLFNKLSMLPNNLAMGNVCNVPLGYLFLRGQGVKSFSLVSKQCRKDGFIMPVIKPPPNAKEDISDSGSDSMATDAERVIEKYEGAIVLDPVPDVHYDPVAVSDYNSLYPSAMVSANLSHETFVDEPAYLENLKEGVDYHRIVYENWLFTKTEKHINQAAPVTTCFFMLPKRDHNGDIINESRGVVPRILMTLLAERKKTKKKMAQEKDPFKAAIYDAAQLAYKITSNSLYGQTGASTSPVCLKAIAASTTAIGRQNLLFARDHIMKHWKAKTIYGDTDSVFMSYPCYRPDGSKMTGLEAVKESWRQCALASKEVSELLPYPHNLEPEKVIMPLLMISRKRYVGAYFFAPEDETGKIKCMGVQLKRNDQPPITKIVYSGIVDILVRHINTDAAFKQLLASKPDMSIKRYFVRKAQDYAQQQAKLILGGKFSIDKFVLSRSLRSEYKNPESIKHKVLADRANERGSDNFQSNDRIHFVHIIKKEKKGEKVLQGEKIETIEYVEQKRLKVDYRFYLTNQVEKPIAQMLALGLEFLDGYNPSKHRFKKREDEIRALDRQIAVVVKPDDVQKFVQWFDRKLEVKKLRDKLAEKQQSAAADITFGKLLKLYDAKAAGMQSMTSFFKPIK